MDPLNVFSYSYNAACSCHPEYHYTTLVTTASKDEVLRLAREYADKNAEVGIAFDFETFLSSCGEIGAICYDAIEFDSGCRGEQYEIDSIIGNVDMLYSPGKLGTLHRIAEEILQKQQQQDKKQKKQDAIERAEQNRKADLKLLAKLKAQYPDLGG